MTNNSLPLSIFDIDGVIADDRWRRDLIDWSARDPDERYERYHLAAEADPLINAHRVEARISEGDMIAFVTARPRRHSERTKRWLRSAFPGLEFIIVMRPDTDHRHSPQLKLDEITKLQGDFDIKAIYEDRLDVIEVLERNGFDSCVLVSTCGEAPQENSPSAQSQPTRPSNLLRAMAETFDARNAHYGDNWRMVPKLVEILFPNGVPQWLLTDPRWHLFELKLVKLTRFAISELRHIDSIHDDGVYSAMIENIVREHEENSNE